MPPASATDCSSKHRVLLANSWLFEGLKPDGCILYIATCVPTAHSINKATNGLFATSPAFPRTGAKLGWGLPHGHRLLFTSTISGVLHCMQHTALPFTTPKCSQALPQRHRLYLTFTISGVLQSLQNTALPPASPNTGRPLPQRQRLLTTSTISGVLQCLQHTAVPPASPYLQCALPHGHHFFTTFTISGVLHCLQHTALPPASPKVGWLLPQRQRLLSRTLRWNHQFCTCLILDEPIWCHHSDLCQGLPAAHQKT